MNWIGPDEKFGAPTIWSSAYSSPEWPVIASTTAWMRCWPLATGGLFSWPVCTFASFPWVSADAFAGHRVRSPCAAYAQRLFEMIAGRDPELLGDFTTTVRPLVPMAYANTVSGDASRRARFHPRWPLIIGGIVAAWLLVGQGVWLFAASDTAEAADQVLRAAGEAR